MINKKSSRYIFRLKGKLMTVYFDNEKGICRQIYEKDEWQLAETITDKAIDKFSLSISENGELYLFCQDKTGNIMLYHNNGAMWRSQLIQKNLTNTVHNMDFHAVINGDRIHLLYNIPTDLVGVKGKRHKIISQQLSQGVWSKSTIVADNVLDTDNVFFIQNICQNHYIMYYQTGNKENSFGYKEFMGSEKWGSFNSLHQTLYTITDTSVITTEEGIHMAVIIKGRYASQLVYRYKLGSEMSTQVVLFEASYIDDVIIFMHKKSIKIIFSAGSYGYYLVISNDDGKSFGRPARLKSTTGVSYMKSTYISTGNEIDDTVINDLLTDAKSPGVVAFIDDLSSEFYGDGVENSVVTVQKPQPAAPKYEINIIDKTEELKELIAEKTKVIAILENKLDNTYKDGLQKNKQILDLNAIISKRNQEIAESNRNWGKIVNRHVELIKELEKRVATNVEPIEEENIYIEEQLSLNEKNEVDDKAEEVIEITAEEETDEEPESNQEHEDISEGTDG